MGMKICPDCHKEMSTTAYKCPHCGREKWDVDITGGLVAFWAILLAVAGVVVWLVSLLVKHAS